MPGWACCAKNGMLNQFLRWSGSIDDPRHDPRHRMGGLSRHRLLLSAVHGAAALRRAGEARLEPARSGGRSRRPAAARRSSPSPCRCRCPASSPAACWCSFRRSASSSFPTCWAAPSTLMIGKVLWDEFFTNSDWPLASAVAICLLVLLVGPIVLFQRQQQRSLERGMTTGRAALRLHHAGLRLRLPLPADRAGDRLLVQQLAPGHGVGRLLDQMVERAVRTTRRCSTPPGCRCASALVSATLAAVLGLAAGYALARVPRFRGRTLFASLVIAPLVMPEVVMGISHAAAVRRQRALFGGPGARLPHHHHRPRHLLARLRRHRRAGAARRLRPLARGGGDGSRRHAVDRPSSPSPCR